MKKLITLIMAIAIVGAAALTSFGQDRNCRRNSDSRGYYSQGNYDNRSAYDNSGYDSRAYYDYGNRRGFWDKHRDKLTVGIGTAAGAVVGSIIGGRRGAAIGAVTGAAGSALYTYKVRNRRYRY